VKRIVVGSVGVVILAVVVGWLLGRQPGRF